MNGISITNSTFTNGGGAAAAAVFIDGPHAQVDGLVVGSNLFEMVSGAYADVLIRYQNTVVKNFDFMNNTSRTAGQDGVWVHHLAALEGDIIDGNTFEGTRGIYYADNYGGVSKNIEITNNTLIGEGGNTGAGPIYLRNITDGFLVQGNTLTDIYGHTVMWIEGPSNNVRNVTIEGNLVQNVAGTLIEGVYLSNDVENGVVRNNQFIQTEEWLAEHPNYDHNWAIRTYHAKGWSITGNHIDGYGARGLSEAPITLHTYDANHVVGNTFGARTNGTTDVVQAKAGGNWFVWNSGATNNSLQTLRPSDAVFDGTNVTFTAEEVDPASGGNVNQDGGTHCTSIGRRASTLKSTSVKSLM